MSNGNGGRPSTPVSTAYPPQRAPAPPVLGGATRNYDDPSLKTAEDIVLGYRDPKGRTAETMSAAQAVEADARAKETASDGGYSPQPVESPPMSIAPTVDPALQMSFGAPTLEPLTEPTLEPPTVVPTKDLLGISNMGGGVYIGTDLSLKQFPEIEERARAQLQAEKEALLTQSATVTQNKSAPAKPGKDNSMAWYESALQEVGAGPSAKKAGAVVTPQLNRSQTDWDGVWREKRLPFIITTQHRLTKGYPLYIGNAGKGLKKGDDQFLIFTINPQQIHMTQAVRGAEQKTRVGTVYYMWRDPRQRTFFDEPMFSFNFDSGNILPWAWLAARDNSNLSLAEARSSMRIPPGLETFYKFLGLLNESKMMPNGQPNFIYITINTRKFPRLTLAGWFTPEGIGGLTDSAEDPNHVTWSANFLCRTTYPRLFNSRELISVFQSATLPVPDEALVGQRAIGTNLANVEFPPTTAEKLQAIQPPASISDYDWEQVQKEGLAKNRLDTGRGMPGSDETNSILGVERTPPHL